MYFKKENKMIIVTGGSGLIGSNLIRQLNAMGRGDIIVVDKFENGQKLKNIFDLTVHDVINKNDLFDFLNNRHPGEISCVFHMGACSDTTEWDGDYVLETNYNYSKRLLDWCQINCSAFVYASSASVYGTNSISEINPKFENPINAYAYSKLLFDNYVRKILPTATAQIVGLRYFNVYGPGEAHKGKMASVFYHLNNQIKSTNNFGLFRGTDGIADGQHSRDFVHVDDTVEAKIWFMENASISGIFNIGTGESVTYNKVGDHIIKWFETNRKSIPAKCYIDFPSKLIGAYQNYTKADLTLLRKVGFNHSFKNISVGIDSYLTYLNAR
jgi:ADP-L-glycero-D-manno-heptose 6-epimerase